MVMPTMMMVLPLRMIRRPSSRPQPLHILLHERLHHVAREKFSRWLLMLLSLWGKRRGGKRPCGGCPLRCGRTRIWRSVLRKVEIGRGWPRDFNEFRSRFFNRETRGGCPAAAIIDRRERNTISKRLDGISKGRGSSDGVCDSGGDGAHCVVPAEGRTNRRWRGDDERRLGRLKGLHS